MRAAPIAGLPLLHHPSAGGSNLDSVVLLALVVFGIALLAWLFRRK